MIGRNIIPMQYGLQTGMTAGPRNVVDYSSLNSAGGNLQTKAGEGP